MTAIRARVFAVLVVVLAAAGCGWGKRSTWDLPPRDERRDPISAADQRQNDADSGRSAADQRAKNEADFRAANPGWKR